MPLNLKMRMQNTNMLNQKKVELVDFGKKKIIIAGMIKAKITKPLFMYFMSAPPLRNKPLLMAGRYF